MLLLVGQSAAAAVPAAEMEEIVATLARSADLTKEVTEEDFAKLGTQAAALIAATSWSDAEKADAMTMLKTQAAAAMHHMETEKAAAMSSVDFKVAQEAAAMIASEANGVTQADLEMWSFAQSAARDLKAKATSDDAISADLDTLLAEGVEEEASASQSARAGWFWSPPPPPPPMPSCASSMLNGHSKELAEKAAHMAKLVYTKGGFDSISTFDNGANAQLKVHYYLENGQHDLDFGEADSTDSSIAWVVFAGSESTDDWIQNAKIINTGAGNNMPGNVHAGFRQQWHVGRSEVQAYVSDRLSKGVRKFVFVGHSLGAAVAAMAAVDMQTNNRGAEVHMITFAGPMVGNDEWVNFANSLMGSRVTRFVVSNDPVPCIPPGYSDKLAGLVFYNDGDSRWVNHKDYSCLNLLLFWNIQIGHHSMGFYQERLKSKCN